MTKNFWAIAFVGLAVSTWWAVAAESLAEHHHLTHLMQTAVVEGAVISAFGVLWVTKFVVFNKILFDEHTGCLDPAAG